MYRWVENCEGAWLKVTDVGSKRVGILLYFFEIIEMIYRGGVERTWCKGDEINSSLSNKKK